MAGLPAVELTQSILNALSDCNASPVLLSSPVRNPRRVIVQTDPDAIELWIYVWTLTHGGGHVRPMNEYRIQLTGVDPPLPINPNGFTILTGYEPNSRCFAGFDIRRHKIFSPKSPSIQIPITALHTALQYGLSFVRKANKEIAIGFRSDQFMTYARNADIFHIYGAESKTVNLLIKAASLEPIRNEELGKVSKERQRIVTAISRLSRDSDFRRKVTLAYDRRCAVTRMQLRLVDAAHILPVGVEGSIDDVCNGLCLSPTYHRAFDRALIYLDKDFVMRMNPNQERELVRLGLNGGIGDFKYYLDKRIHLPLDRNQWPKLDLIQEANRIRKIL